MDFSGRYFIDGIDLWNFKTIVSRGSEDFLRYPARKQSMEHNWPNQNGVEVDLTKVYFDARDITLECAIICQSEADFWTSYKGLLALMAQPGKRRIEIAEFSGQQFFVHYKDCAVYSRFTRIKDSNLIANKFNITLTENEPSIDNTVVYIVDEQGRFLVT